MKKINLPPYFKMKKRSTACLLLGMFMITVTGISCKKAGEAQKAQEKDTIKTTLNVLETLNNGKQWNLVNPNSHTVTLYGISSNIWYPYQGIKANSGSITVTKVNGNYVLLEQKEGTRNDINTFIPLTLTPYEVTYTDSCYLTYDEKTKVFSYTTMPGGADESHLIDDFPFLNNYALVSITETQLVVKYASDDPSGSNSWAGELVFECK